MVSAPGREDPAVEALAEALCGEICALLGEPRVLVPGEVLALLRRPSVAAPLATLAADREPDGLRTAVEALAEEWEALSAYVDDRASTPDQRARSRAGVIAAQQLRTLLAAHPATDQPEVDRG